MEDSLVKTSAGRKGQEERDELQRVMVYPKPIIPRKLNGLWEYQCDKCGRVLFTKKFLNRHMTTHNEKETNSDQVQEYEVEHQVVVAPVPRKKSFSFSCFFCSKPFRNNRDLEDHLRSHVKERPFGCSYPNCEKVFTSEKGVHKHLPSHSNKRPSKCFECKMSFKSNIALNEHRKRMHQPKKNSFKQQHACHFQSCPAFFERRHDLKRHLKTHIDPLFRPRTKCAKCERTFATKENMQHHMKKSHNKDKFKCSYCGRYFFSEDELRKHKQTEGHNREKQFGCAICKVKFPSLKNLDRHLKSERHRIVEEDHKDAEKSAEVQQILAVKNQVLVPNICCKSCTSSFPSEQELAQHVQKIHNLPDERPFCCEVKGCNKAFKRKEHLKIHSDTVHLKLRKYLCAQCGKTFKRAFGLKKHNVRHPDCDVVIRDEQSKQRGNKSEREGKMKNKKHNVNFKIKRAAKASELKGRLLQNTRSSTRLRNKEEEVAK